MPESDKYAQMESLRRKIDDEYHSIETSFGFSSGAFMIIWTLTEFNRPCTQKEICLDWHENKQTINSATKKLVSDGIIEIIPSPDNFREKLLMLTEKGKRLVEHTVKKLIQAERRAFFRLTEEEQNESIRITQKHYNFIKEEFAKLKEKSNENTAL